MQSKINLPNGRLLACHHNLASIDQLARWLRQWLDTLPYGHQAAAAAERPLPFTICNHRVSVGLPNRLLPSCARLASGSRLNTAAVPIAP